MPRKGPAKIVKVIEAILAANEAIGDVEEVLNGKAIGHAPRSRNAWRCCGASRQSSWRRRLGANPQGGLACLRVRFGLYRLAREW